jgi:chlorite dismutase
MVFNLERQSSNAFFSDPVNSASETIMLTGSPQVQGLDGDIYYWLNAENDQSFDNKNKATSILAVVSDTFWMFSTKERANYEIGISWNQCLGKHFPDVLQRLRSAYGDSAIELM